MHLKTQYNDPHKAGLSSTTLAVHLTTQDDTPILAQCWPNVSDTGITWSLFWFKIDVSLSYS